MIKFKLDSNPFLSDTEMIYLNVGVCILIEGKRYQVIEARLCSECAFDNTEYCGNFLCTPRKRLDNKSVIFKEVK